MTSEIISGNDSGAVTTNSPDSEGLFGKLSAELKNEIFELALVAPSAIEIQRKVSQWCFVFLASGKCTPI